MALLHVQYSSPPIGKQTGLYVCLPERPGPLPVCYLLHGLSDDYTIWQRRTSIERQADESGIAVVLLDGGRSFYCDMPNGGGNYEQHILASMERVEAMLPLRRDRGGRAIGGLSMGGYGALKLALKYPERFGSVHAHSGVLDPARRYREARALIRAGQLPKDHFRSDWLLAAMVAAFGDEIRAEDDPIVLAERLAADRRPRPAIRIDCGLDDFLISHNRRMHTHLERLGIAHEYQEFPGTHSWAYWDQHVVEGLAFHRRTFDLPVRPAPKARR